MLSECAGHTGDGSDCWRATHLQMIYSTQSRLWALSKGLKIKNLVKTSDEATQWFGKWERRRSTSAAHITRCSSRGSTHSTTAVVNSVDIKVGVICVNTDVPPSDLHDEQPLTFKHNVSMFSAGETRRIGSVFHRCRRRSSRACPLDAPMVLCVNPRTHLSLWRSFSSRSVPLRRENFNVILLDQHTFTVFML